MSLSVCTSFVRWIVNRNCKYERPPRRFSLFSPVIPENNCCSQKRVGRRNFFRIMIALRSVSLSMFTVSVLWKLVSLWYNFVHYPPLDTHSKLYDSIIPGYTAFPRKFPYNYAPKSQIIRLRDNSQLRHFATATFLPLLWPPDEEVEWVFETSFSLGKCLRDVAEPVFIK